MKKRVILILTILICMCNISVAADNETNENMQTNEIIKSQSNSLNISTFLKTTKEYTTDILDGIDMQTVLSNAIKGNTDTSSIGKNILKTFFKEATGALASIVSIIIIVIVHSILKNISNGLESKTTAQITYYVTYILIVAIIMSNLASIINMIKTTIENLVGFMNCLMPILITLLATTGNIATSTIMQPVILFMITFTGNIITKIIIPFVLVSISLSIISNISDKVQISKLSKFINSTTIWTLGIILTLFVGVTSLEKQLSQGVDAVAAKTTKAAVSTVIPVVGKILR